MSEIRANSGRGKSHTPEWEAWRSMLKRCYKPNTHNFARYGGRGITVCDRWRESFQNFWEDMGARPSPKHSLHRINNDGDYEPSNCEWALPKVQAANRSKRQKRIRRRSVVRRSNPLAANFKDLKGCQFGRWKVLSYHGRAPGRSGGGVWVCRCVCGTERPVKATSLRQGKSKSCGCAQREAAAKTGRNSYKHGMVNTPEYQAWAQMIQRCTNPKLRNYPDYGGRGITVCERWRESFEAFFADVGPRPSSEHSLDRIDNDGNYEPGNVRWATDTEQRNNSRHPRRFEYQEESLSIAEIARRSGVPYGTLRERLVTLGWTVERATTQPIDQYHKRGKSQ